MQYLAQAKVKRNIVMLSVNDSRIYEDYRIYPMFRHLNWFKVFTIVAQWISKTH